MNSEDELFSEEKGTWRDQHQRVIANFVQMPGDAADELKRAERESDAYRLIETFATTAKNTCLEKELKPFSDEAWEIFDEVMELASDLYYPFMNLPFDMDARKNLKPNEIKEHLKINLHIPYRQLIEEAKKGSILQVDRESFEFAIARYVDSKYKLKSVDRKLLVALIDMEISAYFRELFEKDILFGTSMFNRLGKGRGPILQWFLGRVKEAVYATVASIIFILLANTNTISENTTFWIILGIWSLFVVFSIISTIALLFGYSSLKKTQQRIRDLPKEMMSLYAEAHDVGPLSVERIEKRLQQLEKLGAVWPGSLWAMIADLKHRDVIVL